MPRAVPAPAAVPPAAATPAAPWWRDHRRRNRAALLAFAALALLGTLLPAFGHLFGGDSRVLVVTMAQDAGQPGREALKTACGSLPGVSVVPDQGNPDPRVQGRFAVRFSLSGATARQEADLSACVGRQPHVRGFLVEGAGD